MNAVTRCSGGVHCFKRGVLSRAGRLSIQILPCMYLESDIKDVFTYGILQGVPSVEYLVKIKSKFKVAKKGIRNSGDLRHTNTQTNEGTTNNRNTTTTATQHQNHQRIVVLWRTSYSSTTSILTSSITMESQDQPCTRLSRDILAKEDSSAINSLAGAPTTSSLGPFSSTSLSQHLHMPRKIASGLEYSDISTMNNASISSPSGEDFPEPLYTHDDVDFQMTDKHQLILDLVERGAQWYSDLTAIHGLTEAECCECSSRAGFYMHEETFPDNAVNEKLLPHAKEGWTLLKESNRLAATYPQELQDLSKRSMAQGRGLSGF